MNPTVISEEPISMYDAKKILKETKKRDSEISIRSQKCEQYVSQFTKLTDKAYKELKSNLSALEIPRLKEEHICKIIDIMPNTIEEIKVVLSGYAVTVKNDDIKKIDATLSEFRK